MAFDRRMVHVLVILRVCVASFSYHNFFDLDNLAVKPQNLCALRLNIQDAYYVSAARTLLSACKGLRQTGTENLSIVTYIRSDGHSVHGRSIEVFRCVLASL